MIFTDEQLAVVEDRTGPLLVAAGAGSGKTRVMVERIVRAVHEDGVELSRILAITFTEKAAGELADRVRRRFLELGDHDAARDAERAWISTIHGFCARILRAHALAAGVDPEFDVLDETDSAWLQRTAFEDALEVLLDGPDGDAALGDLAPFRVADLRDMVVAAHERLRIQGDARPALPMPEVADPAAACARLLATADVLGPELASAKAGVVVGKAQDAVAACRALAGRLPTRDELDAIKVSGANAKALQTDAADAYRAAYEEVRQEAIDAEALPALRRIDALLRSFGRRYAELKADRSGLDFEDLELRADALLASDGSLRERYAERFVHVMVDEFQDTNPVQLRIIERVASDNLFTVGDEFQSIYSFRHADVELFRARRAELGPAGRVRELAISFRATAPVIAAVNQAFDGNLFGSDFVALRVPERLEAEAEAEPGAQLSFEGLGEVPQSQVVREPRVEILVTEKDKDAGWDRIDLGDTLPRDTVWRLAEARLLAQRISELVRQGRSPGDIAVLARATAGMAVFERALADAGVPTYLIGGRGFWSQRQVADLTAYLAALANPRDDLRLYEALASPLGGVSSDTLALIADAARPRSAWDRLAEDEPIPGLAPDEAERLRAFAALLAGHRELTARLPLDGLIERVIADTRYDLAVLQLPGGERRLANVRKLLRLAREFEAQEGRDLRALVDLVEALAGEELGPDREGEAPVESEDLAAVRIMTIHRAKGLEFPVVCVADMGREPFTGGSDRLRVDREGRIGLKLPSDGNGGWAAFDWQRIRDEQQAEADAEERRLFYVAMTRAQEQLILSGALARRRQSKSPPREPLAWIGSALVGDRLDRLPPEDPDQVDARAQVRCVLNAPPTVGVVLTATAPEAPDPFAEPERAAVAPAPPELEAPPPALPVAHLSYSTLDSYHRCGYRFYLERVLGLPRVAPPPPPIEQAPRLPALVRGSLAHILLEELDLAAPVDPSDEALDLLAADNDVVLTPEDRDDLRDLVRRFAASGLGARLAGADEVRREAGFSFVTGIGEDAVLVNGYVDAMARDADGTLIVDYKTDRLAEGQTPEEVVARDYRIQQVIYALAALRSGAPTVEVAHCFLERADEPVTVRYAQNDIATLEAELAANAAGVRDGIFPVSDRPHYELCATCPGRGTLCSWPEEATVRATPEAIASG